MQIDWKSYDPGPFFDEVISSPGRPRKIARQLAKYLGSLSSEDLQARKGAADLAIKTMGITFTVYSDAGNIDRDWPFDIVPRIISGQEWKQTEKGLVQRLTALNHFIDDVYNERRIFKDRVIPEELLADSRNFRPQCVGMKPAYGVWAHVCGTDLIRDRDGKFYVLEDNLRVPSGVSYMLENRQVTKRVFAELFENHNILPVTEYPNQLFDTLAAISPRPNDYPEVVVLTPGIYNSAYFEHSYLAQQMGAELVEGGDLVVEDDCVYMRTIEGLARVDVISRRIDDLFLDPEVFNPDSALGVPGLMRAWLKGNVGLANAPGAGVADDKVIYTFVPQMIKYYLGEDPILPNVPSYLCYDPKQCQYVLQNLDKQARREAGKRIRRLWHADGTAGEQARARGIRRTHQGGPAQLHGTAADRAVDRSGDHQWHRGTAAHRSQAVHPPGQGQLCDRRRTHARRDGQGVLRGELLAGRREQGHLDRGGGLRCCPGSGKEPTGSVATSSASRAPRA